MEVLISLGYMHLISTSPGKVSGEQVVDGAVVRALALHQCSPGSK